MATLTVEETSENCYPIRNLILKDDSTQSFITLRILRHWH